MAMEDPAREEAPVAAEGAPVATEEAPAAPASSFCAPEAPTDGDAPKSPLQGMMASMICCSTESQAMDAPAPDEGEGADAEVEEVDGPRPRRGAPAPEPEPEPEPAPEPEVAAAPEPEAAPEAPPPAPARRSSMAPKPAPPKKRLSVVEALQASVAAALGAAEDTEEAVVLEAVLQKKGSGGTSLGSVFGGKTGGWKKRKFELVRHCRDDAGVDVGPVLRYYDASRAASRDASPSRDARRGRGGVGGRAPDAAASSDPAAR
ncbi:hypothetical protein JL721_186 [Aureococcus anophagefferens]|nr:hypothetical protein JL721_186 [Aureococcus anophagefferens]